MGHIVRSRRALLLALVLALAGVVFLSPASGAAAGTASRTVLVVNPSQPMIGERFAVSGRLPARSAVMRTVVVERKDGDRWVPIVSGPTDAAGTFALEDPGETKSLKLRVVAPGIKVDGKTYPRVVTRVTNVTIVDQTAAISVAEAAQVQDRLIAAMTFAPGRFGRIATLERLVGGLWEYAGSATTDTAGHVAIRFTVDAAGSYSYRGELAPWNGASGVVTPTVVVNVVPRAISITTESLPEAISGYEYHYALAASGGTPPYTWTAGSDADWLTLSAEGVVSALPVGGGSVELNVVVSDSAGNTTAGRFTLNVATLVDFTSDFLLPDGAANEDYATRFTAEGGTEPYTWTATGLPAGLTMTTDGLLSGRPEAAGVTDVMVLVTDATGATNSMRPSVNIRQELTFVTTSLPDMVVGQRVDFSLLSEGGTRPVLWTATGLPDGVHVVEDRGYLVGEPTVAGAMDIAITLSDPHRSITREFTVTVAP